MFAMWKNLLTKLNLGEIEKEGELTAEMAAAAYSGDTIKFLDDLILLLQEFRAQKVAALAAQASPTTLPAVSVVPAATLAQSGAVVISPFAPVVPSTTTPAP